MADTPYEASPVTIEGNIDLAIHYARAAGQITQVGGGFPGRDSSGAHAVAALAALASAHAEIARAIAAQTDLDLMWPDHHV